jgi:hypothetical protein
VLGLLEDERERIEDEVGAEPDVLRALLLDLRPELAEPADDRVRSIGADDEIGVGQRVDLDAELELDPEPPAPPLEDLEQPRPSDRRERVARGAHLPPAEADVEPVPAREGVGDLEVRLGVGIAQRAERLLAEDHAPAEGRVGRVPLQHPHLGRALRLLQQDRQVEPGRPAADDLDLHANASRSRSSSSTSGVVEKRTSSSQPASS